MPDIREYCIYEHINKINGKKYIGQTRQLPEVRWNNGKGYDFNNDFTKDINTFGWDQFQHLVLYTGLTKEQADKIENQLIEQYNTLNPEFGYNKTINYHVIKKDLTIKRNEYEIDGILKTKRKPIKLILNGRDRPKMKSYIGKTIYEPFLGKKSKDIGKEWYKLPAGILYYYEWPNSSKIQILKHTVYSGNGLLNQRQIKNRITRDKSIQTILDQYKDLIKDFGIIQNFYEENIEELHPFGIRKIYLDLDRVDNPSIKIEFSYVSRKYILKFLDVSLDSFRNKPLEVLQLLSRKGAYEDFIKWGKKIKWTL